MLNGAGRVLIVDDDADTRWLLAHACMAANYVVREAATGQEALVKLQAEPFDVVLLDLGLPDVDGVELLDEIATSHGDLITIILTANPTRDSAIAAVKKGVADYLSKPLKMKEVLEAIVGKLAQRALRQRRLVELGLIGNEIVGDGDPAPPRKGSGEPHGQNSGHSGAQLQLHLDRATRELQLVGEETQRIRLTKGETAVLAVLLENAGDVLSYQALAYGAWGDQLEVDHAASIIRPLIFRLRQKVEPDPSMPRWIRTVRGVGYTFNPVGPTTP